MTDATLFVGGRVFTGRRNVEAVLVEEGRVVAAGSEGALRRAAATGTDRVDLAGNLVVPGLADAHLHLGALARAPSEFDAGAARSIAELGDRLRQWAQVHAGPGIIGRGLDLEGLAEHRWPTAGELDAWVPDRPVVLYHASGHAAVANARALERSSVASSPARASAGPSGVLVEEALTALRALVAELVPLDRAAMARAVQDLAALGLTEVGTMNAGPEELSVLRELDDARRLPIRVCVYPPLGPPPELPHPTGATGRGRLAVGGVKGFLDGAFGPRTASLTEPYADEPSARGVDRGDDGQIAHDLEVAQAAGLSVALHAIGDRAVARAIRLLSGHQGVRARIEHAGLTPPPLLEALRELGAHVVVQPGFVLSDTWLRDRLGPGRTQWAYAFRTLTDLGIPLAGSSDAPYDPPDPWRGMRAAVHRQDELGRSANPWPDQALSEIEALRLYSVGARRALGDEGPTGLEPGARADLVLLSVPRLKEVLRRGAPAVRETWVEGRPVAPGRRDLGHPS